MCTLEQGPARHPAPSTVQHQRRTHPSLLHTFDWAYTTPWLHAHLIMGVCGEEIAAVQSAGHGVYTPTRHFRGHLSAQDG